MKFIISILSLVACSIVIAEQHDIPCHEINDDDKRLACFDQHEKKNELPPLTGTILDQRLIQEKETLDNSFSLTAHRPSYFLPLAYASSPNETPSTPTQPVFDGEGTLDNLEVKFQISFRLPLTQGFLTKNSSLWFGYTQLSLWQLYNSDNSAPFRETNYEPELIWSNLINKSFGSLKLTHLALAINHQSNGRSDPLSRSWNRITLNSIWAYENWAFSFRPWYRLPEADDKDNNPDIDEYMGNFDFRAVRKNDDHQFSSMFRSTLFKDDLRSFYELGYSFSFNKKIRAYVQFVSGYGESLIDYNHRNKRLGIGILISDWF